MEYENHSDTNCNRCTWINVEGIGKETGRLGNKKTSRDHQDNKIIQIGQNTEKFPGDLKRLQSKTIK